MENEKTFIVIILLLIPTYHITLIRIVLIFTFIYIFSEAFARRCSVKKVFFKFCKIRRKIPVLESHFSKIAGLKVAKFLKAKKTSGGSFYIFTTRIQSRENTAYTRQT